MARMSVSAHPRPSPHPLGLPVFDFKGQPLNITVTPIPYGVIGCATWGHLTLSAELVKK